MNNDCCAVLADFGLAVILSTSSMAAAMTSAGGGTVRWMAPELLNPEEYGFTHCHPSKESDIYALGMVIYEVRAILQLRERNIQSTLA